MGCNCGGSTPPVVQSQQAQPGAPRTDHVQWKQVGTELDYTYSPPRPVPVYGQVPADG